MAFHEKNQQWQMQTRSGDISLASLTTSAVRPFYVYNLEDALERADHFLAAGVSVHYAMKANSNPRLLREFAARGLGADVVSIGEMQKALACGFAPDKLIFSGVAKDTEELQAALAQRIFQVNCESFEELQLLEEICTARGVQADVALRLNIHLSAPTHAHVQTATPDSKFGIDVTQLGEVTSWLSGKKSLRLRAIATHIGSQIQDLSVFEQMAAKMGQLYRDLKSEGFALERLDLGGGLGIDYHGTGDEDLVKADEYLRRLKAAHGTDARLLVEPGRFLVARMGALLAKVIYIKKTSTQQFMVLNAGMNCLMRPALYEAYHRISPVLTQGASARYTVVGPICESTDKFATDREMPSAKRGDWILILDAGAYGAAMANTYNESPLPKEWTFLNGRWEVT